MYISIIVILIILLLYRKELAAKFKNSYFSQIIDNYKTDDSLDNDINELIKNDLCGEIPNAIIRKTEKKKNKTAVDYYNVGTIYACHIRNPRLAIIHYYRTLEEIRNGNVKINDAIILLYNLENIIKKIPEIKNNTGLINTLNNTVTNTNINVSNNTRANTAARKYNNTKGKNITTQKQIREKIKWDSNFQNVHDSLISNDMVSQIKYLSTENNKKNIPIYDINQIEQWLLQNTTINISDIIIRIKQNAKLPFNNINIGECDLLCELWRRAHDPINFSRKKDILLSILQSIINCKERDSIVCLTGRATRLMSSLAMIDIESEKNSIGVFKTKTAIRNEILDKSAKIVEKYIGSNSTINKNIIDDYNKGNRTNDVINIENEMKAEIEKLTNEYRGRLDNTKLAQVINECINSI